MSEPSQLRQTESTVDRLRRIERALELGMPPLTIADQKFLLFMATGRLVSERKRCDDCGGDGIVGVEYNVWCGGECRKKMKDSWCHGCNGAGYVS